MSLKVGGPASLQTSMYTLGKRPAHPRHNRQFRRFQHSRVNPLLLTAVVFEHLRVAPRLPLRKMRHSNALGEVMWKITTRGFTLEEVLILAAMNLLASGDSVAKREKQASRK